ncbi:MAG: WGR domain-containing protein [Nannocystales bacterium]
MSEWNVELELVDDKSSKFWRAKTEGSDLIVNYGRIGTDGQTKTKSFGDAGGALAELEKGAGSKRKKGYADTAGAAAIADAPVLVEEDTEGPAAPVSLEMTQNGRTIAVTLRVDGGALHTEVVERYAGESEASAGLRRIQQALVDEGYR